MPRKPLITQQLTKQVTSIALLEAELNMITEWQKTYPFGRDARNLRQAVGGAENRANTKAAERAAARREGQTS